MLSLGLFLYVHSRTGSSAQAGLSAGAFGLGNAVGLSVQGRLIDRYGQGLVLVPAGTLCAVAMVILVAGAPSYALAAAGGGCVPATTGSMRVLLGERITHPSNRTAAYALLGVSFQLALMSGPLAT